MVSGSGDSDVRIWRIPSGECLQVLSAHKAEVYCLACLTDVIASGSSDSTIIIWSYSGSLLHTLTGHLGVVRCLYINEFRLVSGGDQKKINIWDYRSGKLLNTIHRNPTRLHKMLVTDTKLITASPETPGTVTVISYW